MIGADEPDGIPFTTAFEEATDVQPLDVLVTVNVYVVPGAKPEMDVVVPEPVALPDGEPVIVHALTGKPLRAIVPVGVGQVGCVIVPIIGAFGTSGAAVKIAFAEAEDVHPSAFVTVNV
jgi:hypothetical protein